jgi:cytochrome c-type biogenesis protein CcmE
MKNFKLISLGLISISVFLLLIFLTTLNTASVVITPSELIKDNYKSTDRLRVAGRVAQDEILYEVEPDFKLQFFIIDRDTKNQTKSNHENQDKIKVIYEDIKPDMFTNGRDVLIDGKLENKVLIASSILTQCPSKYEAQKGQDK